jgi:hypothetical protein
MQPPQQDALVRHYLLELSLQYYAAGRFAANSQLHRAAPSLLHHAVEFVLKAALTATHSLKHLQEQFGHDLEKLWGAVLAANPGLKTPQRDQTIVDLHKFEFLRYPDNLIAQGATVTIAFKSGENPHIEGTKPPSTGPRYRFNLEDVDELWAALFVSAPANPVAFFQHLSDASREAIALNNAHPVFP